MAREAKPMPCASRMCVGRRALRSEEAYCVGCGEKNLNFDPQAFEDAHEETLEQVQAKDCTPECHARFADDMQGDGAPGSHCPFCGAFVQATGVICA